MNERICLDLVFALSPKPAALDLETPFLILAIILGTRRTVKPIRKICHWSTVRDSNIPRLNPQASSDGWINSSEEINRASRKDALADVANSISGKWYSRRLPSLLVLELMVQSFKLASLSCFYAPKGHTTSDDSQKWSFAPLCFGLRPRSI